MLRPRFVGPGITRSVNGHYMAVTLTMSARLPGDSALLCIRWPGHRTRLVVDASSFWDANLLASEQLSCQHEASLPCHLMIAC